MRRIAVLVFPGIRSFDVSVIQEVWGTDRSDLGLPRFELRRCAAHPSPVAMAGGLTITPDRTLGWLPRADLVLVPGLEGGPVQAPEAVLTALRSAHRRGTPIAALCGGALTLASAGLLDGRRATTHWRLTDCLRAISPAIEVEPGTLFVEDRGIWTSAGTAAGIDLCLHLIRTAHGAEAAATIARSMVTAPFRTGGQAQYIEHPTPVARQDEDALAHVRERALSSLDGPLTVATLAEWAAMSPRSFARHFRATTGTTPHRWLLEQRLAAAQRLLEQTDHPIPEVARRVGFGSEVTLRQHFAAQLGVSPRAYRKAFAG